MADSQRKCLVFVLFFSSLVYSSYSYQFVAGGKDGWVVKPSENYNQWASRMRFQVNDTILFKYNSGSDSVLVVNKDDYDKCNTANPLLKLDDGNSIFKFDRSGPFYFISGNKANCDQGQKLHIVVLAIRSPPSPPSPPTVPSPGAAPPQGSPPSTSPGGGAAAPGPGGLSPPHSGGAPAPATLPSSPSPASGADSPAGTGSGPSPAGGSSEPPASSTTPGSPGSSTAASPGALTPGSGTPAEANSPPAPPGSMAAPPCRSCVLLVTTVSLVLSVVFSP